MIIGPRINTVFRSKWRALWFALSVLSGVWFSIPHHDGDKPDPDAQKDTDAVVSLLHPEPAQGDHHINPWAKNAPSQ